jgi:hypothetical protein
VDKQHDWCAGESAADAEVERISKQRLRQCASCGQSLSSALSTLSWQRPSAERIATDPAPQTTK